MRIGARSIRSSCVPRGSTGAGGSKKPFCGSNACVEVTRDGADYLMRDGKNPGQPALRFSADEWTEFLDGIQYGDLSVM